MVKYEKQKLADLSGTEIAFAAAISGGITRAVCQPFDVLKIRFQLQSAGKKYTSIYQAFTSIIREEGVVSLWKGHIPAQALSIGYGICQFSTWETIKKFSENYEDNSTIKKAISFGAGATGGFLATVATFPCDVIRTRLVAQTHEAKTYNGILHALRFIQKNEGLLTFYKGLYPTLIQVIPYTGAQFMFYQIFTGFYNAYVTDIISSEFLANHKYNFTFGSSMVCGSMAGLCAKVVVYPLDLAKKRIQIQGMENWIFVKHKFHCTGLTNCLILTVKYEGFTGLYKGLMAAALKAVFTSGFQFATYDLACLILRIPKSLP